MIQGQATAGSTFDSGNLINALVYFGSSFYDGQLILSGITFAGSSYQNYLAEIQIFGISAFQDVSIIIIQKSDLPGLKLSSSNRAEQLFTAILLRVIQVWLLTSMAENFLVFHWKNEYINNYLHKYFVIQHFTLEE